MNHFMRVMIFLGALLFFSTSVASETRPDITEDAGLERPLILLVTAADGIEAALWFKGIDDYSRSAAEALDMDLEHMFAGTVRPEIMARVKARLEASPKPNYIVFGNQRSLGVDLLKLAESYRVDAFLYIAPLLDEDYEALGGPRAELKHWIGQLIPDDEQAGYDLTNALIADARQKKMSIGDTSPIKLVGINGRRSTSSAVKRQSGFERALKEHDDVQFFQSVAGRWLADVSGRKYKALKRRYGPLDVVWCANDPMALGVVEAASKESNPPSIGGVDWIPPALDAISQGKFVTSMGGHNFDIAYVMALLRHHYDGEDFGDFVDGYSMTSKLMPMTQDNLPNYTHFVEQRDLGAIDYRAGFSGLMNENILANLSMETFIEQSIAHLEGGRG